MEGAPPCPPSPALFFLEPSESLLLSRGLPATRVGKTPPFSRAVLSAAPAGNASSDPGRVMSPPGLTALVNKFA